MLYIIRHGKTDWNAIHKLQGRTDIPLNEEGRAQAGAAREMYKEISFDICYSSPLRRALETAEIFLEGRNVPIFTDDRLKEMCFGPYEGFENTFEKPDCPIYPLFKDPLNYTAPKGAESIEELMRRTKAFIDEVLMPLLDAGKNVLVVGHGAMNCSLIDNLRGIEKENFWQEMTGNCELKRIEI